MESDRAILNKIIKENKKIPGCPGIFAWNLSNKVVEIMF